MFKLLGKRWKSLVRIIIVVILNTILLNILLTSYISVEDRLNELQSKFSMSLIINNGLSQDSVKKIITQLESQPYTKKITFISSEEAMNSFAKKYGKISQDLMPNNSFPNIIKLELKNDYIDSNKISNIIQLYKKNEIISSIDFKKDYLDTVISIKQQSCLMMIIILSLLGLFIIYMIYLSIRPEFIETLEDYKNINFLGSALKLSLLHVILFIAICTIIGLILSESMSLALWFLTKEKLSWFVKTPYQVLLISAGALFSLNIIVSFICSLIFKKRIVNV